MYPKNKKHKQDEINTRFLLAFFCFFTKKNRSFFHFLRKIESFFHFLLFSLTFLPSLASEKMKEKAKDDILSREFGGL